MCLLLLCSHVFVLNMYYRSKTVIILQSVLNCAWQSLNRLVFIRSLIEVVIQVVNFASPKKKKNGTF